MDVLLRMIRMVDYFFSGGNRNLPCVSGVHPYFMSGDLLPSEIWTVGSVSIAINRIKREPIERMVRVGGVWPKVE